MNIKTADVVKATNKYKNIALFALVVAGLFLFVGFFTQLVTDGLQVKASNTSYDSLTQERVKTELELKDAIAKSTEAQRLAEEANTKANTLREKRKELETSINSILNPETEVKK